MKPSPRFRLLCALAVIAGVATVWPPAAPVRAQEIIGEEEILLRLGPVTKGVEVVPDSEADVVPAEAAARREVTLPAIRFEFDSDRFTPAAREQVRILGNALLRPELLPFSFSVQGHTDSVGDEAYNRRLSQRRARAVSRYLVETMGIAAVRLIEVGLGESAPLPGLAPDDGRNRRVEVVNRGGGAAAAGARPGPARRALLVGIDAYRHFGTLSGAADDARAMAAFIVSHGGFAPGDVRVLTDADATRDNILASAREWLVDGTAAGDEAFLYFSGHGFQEWDRNGDETDTLDETLVPVDAYLDSSDRVAGMISDDEIGALLDELRGRRIRVVVDACHSGTTTKGVGADDGGADLLRYVKRLRLPDGTPVSLPPDPAFGSRPPAPAAAAGATRKGDLAAVSGDESGMGPEDPDLLVWTAVRADQSALMDVEAAGTGTASSDGGSVYTRRLLWGARDGRADADGDGRVTVAELHRYVTAESGAFCARHPRLCTDGLEPQLEATAGRHGDVAFAPLREALSANAAFAKDLLVVGGRSGGAPDPAAPGVRLRVAPGSTLALGTELEIAVDSERGGHLVVLDVDAAGKLTQIFPNERSLDAGLSSRIAAGGSVTLPGEGAGFRFRAVPPTGRGLLVAVVADDDRRIGPLTARHKDLSVVPSAKAYLVEIGEALRGDGAEAWSVGTFEYEIVPSLPRR